MDLIAVLYANNGMFLCLIGLLGLIVGSFLNVVIYRLPIMIANENKQAAMKILGQSAITLNTINLNTPRSCCPHCGTIIYAWYNLPLVSYLMLKGKSHCCNKKISFQYPLVEILSAGLSLLLAWSIGPSLILIASLFLTWSLIALFFIDLRALLLPDLITLPILWLGLFFNAFSLIVSPKDAIIGAGAGYLFFYLIALVTLKIRKIQGLGDGDLKLVAMLGAWVGWRLLPTLIFIASLLGSMVGLIYLLSHKKEFTTQLPFGPFLTLAGFIVLVWGQHLCHLAAALSY